MMPCCCASESLPVAIAVGTVALTGLAIRVTLANHFLRTARAQGRRARLWWLATVLTGELGGAVFEWTRKRAAAPADATSSLSCKSCGQRFVATSRAEHAAGFCSAQCYDRRPTT